MFVLDHFFLVFLSLADTARLSVDDWLAQIRELYPNNPPKISAQITIGKDQPAICFTAESIEDLALGLAVYALRDPNFSLSLNGKNFPLSVIISHLQEKDEILTLISEIRGRLQLTRPFERPKDRNTEFEECTTLYKELTADLGALPDFASLKARLTKLASDLS